MEDNELNREIASELLREEGFLVEEAENGAAAVDRVAHASPGYYDLILMDVQMPVMDGYAATREIRSLQNDALAHIPIVAMTANAFAEDRQKDLDIGMNDHIGKPIDTAKLRQVLAKALTDHKGSGGTDS